MRIYICLYRSIYNVPGDLLDEFAGVRRVKLDAEIKRMGVGIEISLLRLELLANLLTGVEPLLEIPVRQ